MNFEIEKRNVILVNINSILTKKIRNRRKYTEIPPEPIAVCVERIDYNIKDEEKIIGGD